MSRIIAGAVGGRRIEMPDGRSTRPTAERVREALASALEPLADMSVLDLCSGSGAIGLELASRGATRVTLVEEAADAVAVARSNIAALGLPGVNVQQMTAQAYLSGAPVPYDVVFIDPPYGDPVEDIISALGPWLAPEAVVIVERDRRSPQPQWPSGLTAWRSKKYGDTVLWWATATVSGN